MTTPSLADLPPLREALERHGLLARKSFGQHFLLDLNITRKIARLAEVGEGDTVIEVGPGPGGLTRALLETGARVVAVEKDSRFLPLLGELADAADGRLTLVEGDALRADMAALAQGGPAHMVSNLPYNVGTQLLINWLTGPFRPLSMTLMFQKEVADRIAAQEDDDAYGRLAVLSQTVCSARVVMDLPARAFTPPPKVASAVARLVPLEPAPDKALVSALERVTAAAFGQRRKMLRSSLKPIGGGALCEAAGIDPDARAETIPIEGFQALAAALLKA
ncbi:16S rRNA (adenine(1518)-N(6)/adenine(1519)-N(6))-dimethyltransferase RsmA [Caulobacter endophyticus]|uniref:Ribosomal RNA small subunit methyltransferase A n=1 Tax=Caulobacter endophyticus TaxID=2172652 RepID=A0A2T9JS39_9CAUL|nr:16S rRNA (adenine(1518)-N(6)/adenine(1519)-N(6))-dimethyltransferase RsmA [Caulobacter endophyticus]PVM86513.1 16S rRNA (adenine(1518)-N(6)/adenine(1519)-N(6))-dimethyltransferase [Caulobacter endophyticus]